MKKDNQPVNHFQEQPSNISSLPAQDETKARRRSLANQKNRQELLVQIRQNQEKNHAVKRQQLVLDQELMELSEQQDKLEKDIKTLNKLKTRHDLLTHLDHQVQNSESAGTGNGRQPSFTRHIMEEKGAIRVPQEDKRLVREQLANREEAAQMFELSKNNTSEYQRSLAITVGHSSQP